MNLSTGRRYPPSPLSPLSPRDPDPISFGSTSGEGRSIRDNARFSERFESGNREGGRERAKDNSERIREGRGDERCDPGSPMLKRGEIREA